MFRTDNISPLKLQLDKKNPRFLIEIDPTQADIIEYMLINEKISLLADKIAEMNTLLPGERIIICKENGANVVLEGNRRTCIYKMFLDRDLIPQRYRSSFPIAKSELLSEISAIPVDVVDSRIEAAPYLAARHIQGIEKWSSVSQWRISYSAYEEGRSIQSICEYLVLTPQKVKTNIQNYKLLMRGISNPTWSAEERQKLNLLYIQPDRLIRIIRSGAKMLGIYFDDKYDANSSTIPTKNLDEIIKILTYKAFIEVDTAKRINTRSTFADVLPSIQQLIPIPSEDADADVGNQHPDENSSGTQGNHARGNGNEVGTNSGGNKVTTGGASVGTGSTTDTASGSTSSGTGQRPRQPYFFDGLDSSHLSTEDMLAHGLLRINKEIRDLSVNHLVGKYTLSAVFLTRALIEQSLKYYAKKHSVQGSSKTIWELIELHERPEPKLGRIVKEFIKQGVNFIPDKKINSYFQVLFKDYDPNPIDSLNWVVHRPDEYAIVPADLISLPAGLLAVINYLIS